MELNDFIIDGANEHYRNLGGFVNAYCRYLSKNFNEEQIKELIKKIRNPKYEQEIKEHFKFEDN